MFERLLAWHEQLIALAEAGAPFDLAAGNQSPRATLERYAARIAVTLGRGVALPAAIADDPSLPAGYRAAALLAVRGQEEEALELLSLPASIESKITAATRRAFTTPIILLGLALVGGSLLATLLAPTLADLYQQMQRPPDAITRLLLAIPLPETALLIALAGCLAIVWRRLDRRRRSQAAGRVGEAGPRPRPLQPSALARSLARLIQLGLPPHEALQVVGHGERKVDDRRADVPPRRGARYEAAPSRGAALPPLIVWALTHSHDTATQVVDLDFAADTYRKRANRRADWRRRWAPAIGGGVLGGLIVLVYGLAVFLPVIRLLETVSRPY